MTTPELLDAVAEGAEARGIGTIWVGEHVVLFGDYESSYPYADDGRIPAPPGQRAARAAGHPDLPGGTDIDGAPRHGHAAPPPAQPRLRGQGGQHARLALGWPGRPRHRRGLAQGGVRRAQRARGSAGAAGPTSTSRCCARSGSTTRPPSTASSTTSPACEMFPKPVQRPHPPVHIGGETPAALRRAARLGQGWHTFNRSPDELAARPGRARRRAGGGGADRDRAAHHGVPVLQPADARVGGGLRRGGRRRGGRALLRLHARRRWPRLRRPRGLP